MIKFFEPIFSALNFDSNALQISFGDLIMWKDHRFNLEEWWVVPLQTSSFSICFFLSPLFLQNLHHLLWEIALNLGARHKLSRLSEKNFILSFHLVKLVPSNQSSFTNSWFNILNLSSHLFLPFQILSKNIEKLLGKSMKETMKWYFPPYKCCYRVIANVSQWYNYAKNSTSSKHRELLWNFEMVEKSSKKIKNKYWINIYRKRGLTL